MIRSRDVNIEIESLSKLTSFNTADTDVVTTLKGILKAQILILKVTRDIKSNQVTGLVKEYGKDILMNHSTPEKTSEKRT